MTPPADSLPTIQDVPSPTPASSSTRLGWLTLWMSGTLAAFIVAAVSVRALSRSMNPFEMMTVRNAGGMATVSLNVRQGRWHPVLEGNATFVYRAEVDPAALARDAVEPCDDEVRAYAALDERNAARLREAGVTG